MLMALLRMHLRMFLPKLRKRGIRFHHLGAVEGLPQGIYKDLQGLEAQTAEHKGMVFHLAVNYGSRLELVHAAKRCLEDGLAPQDLDEEALNRRLWTAGAPDVDLLIRTSGEHRISNFLLWQAAYAEFFMTDCLWPDFRGPQLREAVAAFGQRERRFGGI